MIKKIGKVFLGFVLLLIAVAAILFAVLHESRPQVTPNMEADVLANKMLTALDYEAYKNTRFLEWSFASGGHNYMWDKQQQIVNVSWKNHQVTLHLKDIPKSKAIKNGIVLNGTERLKTIKMAHTKFNNDSFWLVAPYKVFDTGTQRSLVPLENGSQGLLVTYTSGGDTPGDSYLWTLDPKGIPQSFKMWVKIIPLGGLEASWEGWQVMDSGAKLPTMHQLGPFNLGMGAVKGFNATIEHSNQPNNAF
ncbi:hypothetical protein KCTC52924_03737 [Arenibacter antarcticus]|uniref:Uncharacterized protein n=1 Tax=Arenibacter antarcticus TaxID=2040469 RepID=A0ABW5VFA2_9FLAO|nr:hypothetical protein [Arenibacter sp. H213]MCM4168179.1 hypothetical protein [Arenibacter sp. H213]